MGSNQWIIVISNESSLMGSHESPMVGSRATNKALHKAPTSLRTCSIFHEQSAKCACAFECYISFNLFSFTNDRRLCPSQLYVFILIYIYQRDMTVQFVARVVATFTIIFLLGCFCMSWQIFIGYRNIIRSAHNRPHKAPCHTVVERRMRPPDRPDPGCILFVPGRGPVFSEKWKKWRY